MRQEKYSAEDIFAAVDRRAADDERKSQAGLPACVLSQIGGGEADAMGVDSNNMTPCTSNWADSEPCEISTGRRPGGIDWLSFSYAAEFQNWAQIRDQLEAARLAAAEAGKAVSWEVAGVACRVLARGEGKGSSYRKYVLRVGGLRIGIRDAEFNEDKPNIFVEMRGDACLISGVPTLLREFHEIATLWRLVCGRSWVSRVDLCVDLADVSMTQVFSDFHAGLCIGVAKNYVIHGEWHAGSNKWLSKGAGVQTLTIGAPGADCQLRMYDKLCQVAGDKDKVAAMSSVVWGGSIPQAAVRVEYQVRRAKLLELNVSTLDDLLGSLGRISEYLTRKWFRVADSDVDRTNTTRAKSAGWWSQARGRFQAWTSFFCEQPEVVLVKGGSTPQAMLNQAVGCVQRVCAEFGTVPSSPADILALLTTTITDSWDDFRAGVADKLDRISSLTQQQVEAYFETVGGGQGRMRLRGPDVYRGVPFIGSVDEC